MTTAPAAPQPLPKLLAIGLAYMIAVGLLAVLLVRLLPFPYAVAFGGLACFAGGVPLAMRFRTGALFALGLFGLFGYVAAAAEAELWMRFRVGVAASLDSIEAAPLNPQATVLRFPPADARPDLAGEARTRTTYSNTSPPAERAAFAVPLVPPGWALDRPVTAWLVCEEARSLVSQAPSCASRMPAQLSQAWRAPSRPEAAQAAMLRHGLTQVAEPAFLSASDGIAAEQAAAGWMVLAWPALAWLGWALAVAVWRVVPGGRRR